ncbi:transcriptional regulator [Paenibacillus odorifer]|uniref:helix-turn-helix domain-containing protein n=1 Tax=Paenibacillus TaxID=44249 RepID=UPI00096ED56F|nr:helix-turn-helix transcriptional regulator [Paenibacillus odorifer]OMD93014.1 transcriptional regulator [Paenibacillus odorifer]
MTKRRLKLIACREKIGDRKKVAADLNISVVYLRMLETGALKPGRDLMLRISNYFEKPLEYLFPDLFSQDGSV